MTKENNKQNQKKASNTPEIIKELPVLPLRDVVVFPRIVNPLFVGRQRSVNALEYATRNDNQVMLITQKNAEVDDPKKDDLYQVGVIGTILQILKLSDETIKLLIEGDERAKVLNVYDENEMLMSDVEIIPSTCSADSANINAMSRLVIEQYTQYTNLNKKANAGILHTINSIEEPGRLADTLAHYLPTKIGEKQELIETFDEYARFEKLMMHLNQEVDILKIGKQIRGKVQKQMEKSQREYYLNEQLKAIQQELHGGEEGVTDENAEYAKRIEKAKMPKEVAKKAKSELNKLSMMTSMSAEAAVVRNYIEWLVDVPWSKKTRIKKDLKKAKQVLDADHYGLNKVKERILEYLAVQQKTKKMKGPILCFVGPPGVGKTSLGKSIANATGRRFLRMALGGIRDEAEIRGHRRTYIGALPGKLIQNLVKAGVRNPLFLLDEVDKMSMDYRGDPSSALLEVLDPEQNHTFSDHYLEVDFDLSDVMFVCTANSLNIPSPLLDRMEVINLSGYTEEEKVNIAKNYLVPKQVEANGLSKKEIQIMPRSLVDIVQYYTREAGVRNLERAISKICRKVVKDLLLGNIPKSKSVNIQPRVLEKYLGVRKFRYDMASDDDRIGLANGLAWTESGGELLTIEATVVSGKGNLKQTGQLGEVMQESGHAAMTVVRSRAHMLAVDSKFYEEKDIHVHVPEGATPKDGPSAGISMCTAIVSALTRIPIKSTVAMTGEITLRGEILAIGGLKEKLLAALRSKIQTVIIPKENQKDLKELPSNIINKLEIKPVQWIDEVLDIALVEVPLSEEFKAKEKKDEVNIRSGEDQKYSDKSSRLGRVSRH